MEKSQASKSKVKLTIDDLILSDERVLIDDIKLQKE